MAGGDRAARRAELEAELAALDADDDDDGDYEYWIERGDNRASVPARSQAGKRIAAFFKDSFGIDLAGEPRQEGRGEPGDDDQAPKGGRHAKPRGAAAGQDSSAVVRFGRRAGG